MKRLLLGALLALGACSNDEPMTYRDLDRLATQQQREAIGRPAPDTCQMAAHQSLIGQDGAAIDRSALPAGARVICHQCAVTLDYSAERLNIQLGADGKVESMRCG
ncbi:MAG: hypothetical protein JNJ63_05180 [Hyphomonadaceae bacterium]|nr:hypothetical protein [Hyphomonadaceae bacterium]